MSSEGKRFSKKDLQQVNSMLRFYRQNARNIQDTYKFYIAADGALSDTELDIYNGNEAEWPGGEFFVLYFDKNGALTIKRSVVSALFICLQKMIFYCTHTHEWDNVEKHMKYREIPIKTGDYFWFNVPVDVNFIDEQFLLAFKMKQSRDENRPSNITSLIYKRSQALYGDEWDSFFTSA